MDESTSFVTIQSFTAALPVQWQQFGPEVFRCLTGSNDPVSTATLDAALARLERSSSGLALCGQQGLEALIAHGIPSGLALEPGTNLTALFPTLPLKVADAFLDVVAPMDAPSSSMAFRIEGSTTGALLGPWQLQLLSLALLPLGHDVNALRLYALSRDGLSFKTLLTSVMDYAGPVVVAIRDRKDRVFGFATPSGIPTTFQGSNRSFAVNNEGFITGQASATSPIIRQSSSHLHIDRSGQAQQSVKHINGLASSFALFQIFPEFRLRRWRGFESGRNFMRVEHGWGIGLGGQADLPRLKISSDLRTCSILPNDATYEAGEILSKAAGDECADFVETEISEIEVWGVGTTQDALDFERHKRDMHDIKEDRKKVDKRMLVESDFDKEMFFGNTFAKGKEERP